MKITRLILATAPLAAGLAVGADDAKAQPCIVRAADLPANVKLAAEEIRRYVYLRTGALLPVVQAPDGAGATIVLEIGKSLEPQQYRLKTAGTTLTLSGGSDIAVLYGAYALAEKLGVRFYLHGDVVPDARIPFALPQLDETCQPLFAVRGVNPWGCHPYGMDAWSADDYKTVFTQLAKMRMNFLGVHCYPEGPPYAAEPTVWLGLPGDFDAKGQVKSGYPSHYFSALANGFGQAYRAKETGKYNFGGAGLFERDDWAPPVMAGYCPVPTTPEGSNEVFNRMAGQFHDAFSFARCLGVRTCLGTEAPLTIPGAVQERLRAQGKNPADPAAVREVYEGTFRRIMASHPLDYYWLWTPESWGYAGNNPEQYQATVADIKLAHEALRNVGAPFKLATSGWVLGPAHDRAAFDRDLPKDVPMSALSRVIGHGILDPAYERIAGREKWAIPWLESDGVQGLTGMQLYAGRMRRDAADAAAYGCTGLIGLHWRTEILAPNVSALAMAAWDQSWNPKAGTPPQPLPSQLRIQPGENGFEEWARERYLPCGDFYADWARANFGPEAADPIARLFTEIDGRVPLATLDGCPVAPIDADATPWATVAARFTFVDAMEKLRPSVRGAGNLDRFDYWLNTFLYYRSLAHVRCALGAKAAPEEITRLWSDTYRYLLASVNTPGALAAVVTMENNPSWGELVARQASQPWPKDYAGAPRLIMTTVRSIVEKDEALTLTVIALDKQPMKNVVLKWRPLGRGAWRQQEMTCVTRAIHRTTLPPATESLEYHIQAGTASGAQLVWPATAPGMNQTVVVTGP